MQAQEMWIQLTKKKWLKKADLFPESNNVNHIVDVSLKDGTVIKKAKVFNRQILQVPGIYKFKEKDVADIKLST